MSSQFQFTLALDKNKNLVVPFDDIMQGSTVRLVVIDGKQYLSIVDIIMCVCGKNSIQANEVWDRLNTKHKEELTANCGRSCGQFKFRGRGQQVQPVITFPGALKLITFLPGDVSTLYLSVMYTILQWYYPGDLTLPAEVESEQVSESPDLEVPVVEPSEAVPGIMSHEECLKNIEDLKAMKLANTVKLAKLKSDSKVLEAEIQLQTREFEHDKDLQTRKFEHDNELLDKESLYRRNRLREEARVRESSIVHAHLADLVGCMEGLATTMRDLNYPEDLISTEVTRHVMYLKARAAILEVSP